MGEVAIMINRRSLITGLISFVAAPAIVRVANIMPVKPIGPMVTWRQIHGGTISGGLNAEEATRFYNRLKVYMREVGIWDKIDTLYDFAHSPEGYENTNWRDPDFETPPT
jgi:hypothetical protein